MLGEYSNHRFTLLSLLEVISLLDSSLWQTIWSPLWRFCMIPSEGSMLLDSFLARSFLCSVLFWTRLLDYISVGTCIVESTSCFSSFALGYTCKYLQGFPLLAGNENGGYGLLGARVSCVASGHLDGLRDTRFLNDYASYDCSTTTKASWYHWTL